MRQQPSTLPRTSRNVNVLSGIGAANISHTHSKMETSTNPTGTIAQLSSSLPTATQSTYGDTQETAVACDTQGQIGNREVGNAVSATMSNIMNDPSHTVPTHSGQAYKYIVGDQDSGVSLLSSKLENESRIQELGDKGKSPIRYSSDIGGDDVHDDNRGILGDPVDEDTSVSSFGEAEEDDDDGDSAHERDHETERHSCIHCSHPRMHDYPRTRHTLAEHISIPGQQSFNSLDELLVSHNAPGRGLYKIEEVVREKRRKAAELEEDIRCLQAQLDWVTELRDEASTVMLRACTNFSDNRGAAGISNHLWAEYEAFCESLEPKFGCKRGWSVTCFQNHNSSYLQWDSDLDLFKDTAEISLVDCNFRCEASTINTNGSTEYVVEFWALDHLEPRNGSAKTWSQQYPKLYRLAKEAVHNSLGNNTVPQELLSSLPNPSLPFAGGWLFEYASEPARGKHATLSRRWSYRRACRIPLAGQEDYPQGYLATTPESDSATSQDREMDDEGSESCESHDVDMEDDGSGSDESGHTE